MPPTDQALEPSSLRIVDYPDNPLNHEQFVELYREHGAILFRRAADNDAGFAAFTDQFGCDWMPYQLPGRKTVLHQEVVQTVNTGAIPIPPHSELCHKPGRPKMACLYCDRPPICDGETTLYDGIALAAAMPEQIRAHFRGRQLRYATRMTLPDALAYYNVPDRRSLEQKFSEQGWNEHMSTDDDYLYQDYRISAFPIHSATGREVFVNQIVHNARQQLWPLQLDRIVDSTSLLRWLKPGLSHLIGHLPQRLRLTKPGTGICTYPTLEDGSLLEVQIIRLLHDFVLAHEQVIDWKAGDVLIFDNERYMHGRRQVSDPDRRILTRFGFPRRAKSEAA